MINWETKSAWKIVNEKKEFKKKVETLIISGLLGIIYGLIFNITSTF